ncbi:MAG TPA: hypothetical protein VNJ70_00685 [Thermoanaerobaculia bacterium]|nr:hypothetical protein [Thermoanaerobaculia bacterium]
MAAVALRLEDYAPTDFKVRVAARPAALVAERSTSDDALNKALDATRLQFQEHTAELETRLSSFKQGFARLVHNAEEYLSKGTPVDLAGVITQLRSMEEIAQGDVEPLVNGARSYRALAMKLPPGLRAREVALWDRHINTLLQLPEILRDARWQLLAVRAGAEKQTGRRFDSADELARYLDSL